MKYSVFRRCYLTADCVQLEHNGHVFNDLSQQSFNIQSISLTSLVSPEASKNDQS